MVHSRVAGVRTAWRVEDDGDFFCASCGGDRCYQRLSGRRRLMLLGLPVLPRGAAEPVVECVACRGRFPLAVLRQPTTTRLTALLRDAVHTVALAMLATAGNPDAAVPVRRGAVEAVRAAGFADCTEERLLTLRAALGARGPEQVEHEVRQALSALAPHLAGPGRESLLLHGARIALTDGPYRTSELAMLSVVGEALRIGPADTERLLATAALSA
ncbi:TerB family tellurite resistance protein [Streptomyces marincola]|uniref:TerB family tellurite resistance protein n=1 Tax=Streptomyces marincola TaxID=2878388 RepID=UPI001CF59E62|nr:TerB family tellurite resistance protein [Streptomyces marincola]UCM87816.1 TerB family tellurite resistance protein [Streptomyces marincola]